MLNEIIAYCVKDLDSLRSKKTASQVRQLISGDRSLVNIYNVLYGYASNPAYRKIKTIPKDVLEAEVSRTNKYYEDVTTNMEELATRISDIDTLKVTIESELRSVIGQKMIELVQNEIVKDYELNRHKSLQDNLRKLQNLATAGIVETVTPQEVVENMDQYLQMIKGATIPTGYSYFDEVSDGGFRRSQIWGFGGNSGMGKTWFACNLVMKQIGQNEMVYMSNEMTRNELLIRLKAINDETSERSVEDKGMDEDNRNFFESITDLLTVYENVFTVNRIERIVDEEASKGRSLFILDHFHNLSMQKQSEGESQAWASHELQRIAFEYGVTLILFYQKAKADYQNNNAGFKGRNDSIETSNYGFNLYVEEDKQDHRLVQEKERQKIITVNPVKVRRGIPKKFYLFQNFKKGGMIEQVVESNSTTKMNDEYPNYHHKD